MRHALPAKAEGTTGPMAAVEVAGRAVEGEVAGQAGVDGDRSELSRDLGASSRAPSLRDNPAERYSVFTFRRLLLVSYKPRKIRAQSGVDLNFSTPARLLFLVRLF